MGIYFLILPEETNSGITDYNCHTALYCLCARELSIRNAEIL